MTAGPGLSLVVRRESTIPPVSPDRVHAIELHRLESAVLGVLDGAWPRISAPERTAVLAEALLTAVLDSDAWCCCCQADAESLCKDHTLSAELVNAFRRVAYRQLPGNPRIDVDL